MTLDPTECEHEDWHAFVDIVRISEVEDGPIGGYTCQVRAECAECSAPMIWHVPDFGLLSDRPTVSVNGQELRLPGRPATEPDDFGLQLPGFSIRGFQPRSDN